MGDIAKAEFETMREYASAAAWSPNPKKPPLIHDLLYRDNKLQPIVAAKCAANTMLTIIDAGDAF